MATYKVIQDIEAEDKLVGPLSFRQFIYFLIGAFLAYINFICIAKGAAFLTVVFAPPTLFCMFFAWPWTPDQPTEVWALARIRFLLKSRKRIWDQSGIKEFVTVTVPKKIERHYTDGLSQKEVRSRLQALAQTIDSRGWVVKNANLNEVTSGSLANANSDRLLDFSAMPQQVADVDVRADDDILDETSNPLASHMGEMINASSKARRQELMDRLQNQDTKQGGTPLQWFRGPQPSSATTTTTAEPPFSLPPVGVYSTEPLLPPAKPSATSHLKTLPLADHSDSAVTTSVAPTPGALPAQPEPAITAAPDPAILNLAHDNNLDVATLAREANKVREMDASDDEVVISLH